MLKQMPSQGSSVVGGVGPVAGVGNVGGVGGVGGGVFPPQISPQQLAMLSNIYPHVQQFHLVCAHVFDQTLPASSVNPWCFEECDNCFYSPPYRLVSFYYNSNSSSNNSSSYRTRGSLLSLSLSGSRQTHSRSA